MKCTSDLNYDLWLTKMCTANRSSLGAQIGIKLPEIMIHGACSYEAATLDIYGIWIPHSYY